MCVFVGFIFLRQLLELECYVKAFRRLGYNQTCKVLGLGDSMFGKQCSVVVGLKLLEKNNELCFSTQALAIAENPNSDTLVFSDKTDFHQYFII